VRREREARPWPLRRRAAAPAAAARRACGGSSRAAGAHWCSCGGRADTTFYSVAIRSSPPASQAWQRNLLAFSDTSDASDDRRTDATHTATAPRSRVNDRHAGRDDPFRIGFAIALARQCFVASETRAPSSRVRPEGSLLRRFSSPLLTGSSVPQHPGDGSLQRRVSGAGPDTIVHGLRGVSWAAAVLTAPWSADAPLDDMGIRRRS
jgi:hypothetical protein